MFSKSLHVEWVCLAAACTAVAQRCRARFQKWETHLLLYLVRPQLGPAMLLEESACPLVPTNSGDLQVGQWHQLHENWICKTQLLRSCWTHLRLQHNTAMHLMPGP